MKRIITFSGHLGSGKSEVGKILSSELTLDYVSAGDVFRQVAADRGMSLPEFMQTPEADSFETNLAIDNRMGALAESGSVILDGRMAWQVVPDEALKVMLLVHPRESARRIFNAKRSSERYESIQQAEAALLCRQRKERGRFLGLYQVDMSAYSNFDAVIDTTCATIDKTAKLVRQLSDMRLRGEAFPKYWVSPHNVFCTELSREISEERVNVISAKMATGGYDVRYPVDIGRIGSYNFLVDGHHRGLSSIENCVDFIPANVSREHDLMSCNPGLGTPLQLISAHFNLATVYDWEDIVRYRTGNKDYTLWTYPPCVSGADQLDLKKVAEESWDRSWYDDFAVS